MQEQANDSQEQLIQDPDKPQPESHPKAITDLISLPKLKEAKLFTEHLENTLKTLKRKVSSGIFEAVLKLHGVLSGSFYYYDHLNKHQEFQFKLPPSQFPPSYDGIRKQSFIIGSSPIRTVDENTFKDRLTPQQLQQISKDGTFLVPSAISTVPYKWQLHPRIFKGSDIVLEDWYKDLSVAYHQLRQVEKRFTGQTLSLKANISEFKFYPKRMANLLVGLAQFRVQTQPDYDRLVQMDFLIKKYDKYFASSSHKLYDYLYVTILRGWNDDETPIRTQQQSVSYKNQEIRNSDQQFETQWNQSQRKIIKDYRQNTDPQKQNQQDLNALIKQRKEIKYKEFATDKLPQNIREQIFDFVKIFSIIRVLQAQKDEEYSRAYQKTRQNIQNNHKIRGRETYFLEEQTEAAMKPISQALDAEFYQKVKAKLNNPLYDQYLQFRQTYSAKKQKIKGLLPEVIKPRRTFRSTYQLFPPYQVLRNGNYYYLKTKEEVFVHTDHHFWKLSLYVMRVKTWTINLFFALVMNAWVGPLGIKVLITLYQFPCGQYVNSSNGTVTIRYRDGLWKQFERVLQGIKRSRQHFQSLPDTGLFGKNMTRIVNYFECYIYRLLFVGILIVLILKPIFIVVNCVVSLFGAVTCWFWTPLSLIVTYLFNVLIYQFEIDDGSCYGRISERWIPLLNTPLMLLLNVVRVVAYLIGAAVVHPLIALIVSIFAVTRRIFRVATDFLMMIIVKALGRTPASDSNIAWKISGPGLSRRFYSTISQQDTLLLVLSNLQNQFLTRFTAILKGRINQPLVTLNSTMAQVSKVFECTYNTGYHCQVRISTDLLLKDLDKQVARYSLRYPVLNNSRNNIRFTQEQLDEYFDNSKKIVSNFIKERQCEGWIYKSNDVDKDDLEGLTRAIWLNIFGNQIFQHFEDLDMRLEASSHERGLNTEKEAIMRALEGQLNLSVSRPKLTKAYKQLQSPYINIVKASDVVDLLVDCSGWSVRAAYDNVEYGLIHNPNIKELLAMDEKNKRYDRYQETFA